MTALRKNFLRPRAQPMGLSQSSTANVTLAPSLLPCNTPRAQRLSTTLQAIPSNLVAMGQQKPKPSHATRLRFYLRTILSGQKLVEKCGAAPKEREKALRELKLLHGMASKMESRLKELSAGTATATTSTEAPSLRLLALGDSITDGGAKLRAYRYHLHRSLQGYAKPRWLGTMAGIYDKQQGRNASRGVLLRRLPDWPIDAQAHEGHWGWTSKQVLRGHERQPQRGKLNGWLKRMRVAGGGAAAGASGGDGVEVPDVAFVHLGTNDLTKLVLKSSGPHEAVGTVAKRVGSIISQLCATNPKVHVLLACSILPYCRFKKSGGAKASISVERRERRNAEAAYSRELSRIAARLDRGESGKCARGHVACVNMSAVVGCEHLTSDGVHPSAAGARRMAAAFWKALEPRIKVAAS